MTSQTLDIQYYTRKQSAKFLNDRGFPVTETTLATKNSRGGGPRYFKFGKYALYTGEDLLTWATAGMGSSCSTATERRHASKTEVAE
jgi:hypothetical protein